MRHAGRLLTILGWIVVVPLAGVAIARIVAWDSLEPLVVLDAVTAWIYLPAWLVAVAAVIGRRRLLAFAALAVAVAQIAFLAPELSAGRPLPAWTRTAPSIRLFDANVYDANPSMAGYVARIEQDRPDLVTLEEANPSDARQLERSGALDRLPYRFEVSLFDPSAFLIASRYPLRATHVLTSSGLPLVVQTHVVLPTGTLTVWVVHTLAPVPVSWREWSNELRTIAHLVRMALPRRLLVVGDFNATWGNKAFRGVLAAGVTDGAAARDQPFEMTWSQMMPPLPPFVRIDHVLAGPNVSVERISTGDGPGSDHRYVTATVAVRH
ncbi:MAG: Endonuclease/exonuclease/phosphatase [Acidimicrobiaceae bacterium]|nr:Endonuclease/exonuclease/phosphatase [Acidimicrobiaceae bacterium]